MAGSIRVQATDFLIKAADIRAQKTHSLEDYRAYEFLFVPGLLYDPFIQLSQTSAAKDWHLGEYFVEMRDALKKAGVSEQIAEMGAEDSIFDNSWDLAKRLSQAKRPVILITHSKGGLETLDALLEYPHLRSKVAGWISIQAPFRGSPIADIIYTNRYSRSVSKKLLEGCFKGSLSSLEELQTQPRRDYMNRKHDEIIELAREIPITSVGSWISAKTVTRESGIPSLLTLEKIMSMSGAGKNDGLVELTSARLLPDTASIQISEMDHADPVMRSPGRHFDRVGLLKFLLEAQHDRLTSRPKP